MLAAGDAFKEVKIWDTETWAPRISGRWVFHTTRVMCLAWSADSARVASGSGDDSIIVWSVPEPANKTKINNAHAGGVCGLSFLEDGVLTSGGNDGCVATWALSEL